MQNQLPNENQPVQPVQSEPSRSSHITRDLIWGGIILAAVIILVVFGSTQKRVPTPSDLVVVVDDGQKPATVAPADAVEFRPQDPYKSTELTAEEFTRAVVYGLAFIKSPNNRTLRTNPQQNQDGRDLGIALKNSVGSFDFSDCGDSLANFNYLCPGESGHATVKLTHITKFSSTTLAETDVNNKRGIAIAMFDFGTSGVMQYLITFSTGKTGPQPQLNIISTMRLLSSSRDSVVENINIQNDGIVVVSGKNVAGKFTRAFTQETQWSSEFVELSADRSQKIYDNNTQNYSGLSKTKFLYPKDFILSTTPALRATQLEQELKKSPVYYGDVCGLEPGLADAQVSFRRLISNNPESHSAGYATFSIHPIASSTVSLTSSLYGYNPADWNKIVKEISLADYARDIRNGSPVTGKQVKLETIGKFSVRHIFPISSGRPCDTSTFEQYQWVTGNALFSLVFIEPKDKALPSLNKKALLDSILSSLEVK